MVELENNPTRLINTAQAMHVLEVSNATLFRWRKAHLIPCIKVGGVYKYKAADIINFLKENAL